MSHCQRRLVLFIVFMRRLIKEADRKVFLIVDNLKA